VLTIDYGNPKSLFGFFSTSPKVSKPHFKSSVAITKGKRFGAGSPDPATAGRANIPPMQ
jgi:hypothetical protein